MNEQTIQLLNKLAATFGTTAEYLWNVLLKQAPIDALSSLIVVAFFFGLATVSIKITQRYYKKIENITDTDCHAEKIKETIEGRADIFEIISFFLCLIAIIVCACLIQNIIIGFFNPEYWALQKILSKV